MAAGQSGRRPGIAARSDNPCPHRTVFRLLKDDGLAGSLLASVALGGSPCARRKHAGLALKRGCSNASDVSTASRPCA